MSSVFKSAFQWVNNGNSSSQKNLCETCGKKPKFVENGFQHPYCSRTCARSGSSSKVPLCVVSGCRQVAKPAYGGCCSDEHFREAQRNGLASACAQCRSMPQAIGQLCTACERRRRAIPRLQAIEASSWPFSNIVTQFSHDWRDAQPASIMKVIEIIPARETRAKFDAYRRKLDETGKSRQLRTYHASQCICDFGVNDLTFCTWQSCGICSILKSSFTTFAFNEKHNTGRFGDGVYSYINPALADKFATSSTSSPYRVMIACDVSVLTAKNDKNQVVDGGSVFVANPDAILPVYVILYKF
ncbi:hypothetical protein BDY19DRAFT_991587 [Irpex rosettiformis]|uniref:Uncharacterized protein n=1 Tax=Irpex rosettiformis TaxID=378272 RepID=A0ACB8U9Q6_9APHY|nr:hypothetical protein BDY19DRAFT_991587 [Irpex rosettiformis]